MPTHYKYRATLNPALLQAELLSIEGGGDKTNDEAATKYNVAIEAAKASKFVHEEGLGAYSVFEIESRI